MAALLVPYQPHNPRFLVQQESPPSDLELGEAACKLWNSKNSHLVIPAPDLIFVLRLQEEICASLQKQARKGRLQLGHVRFVRWLPPPFGLVKLNTDGALKYHNGHASVGGLIRDCYGRWIKGFARNLGHYQVDDILTAELMGVREGLYVLANMNLHNAVIEMDCEVAVKLLNSGVPNEYPEKDDSPKVVVLKDCVRMMRFMKVIECRHTLREGNQCADFLANLGQSTKEGVTKIFDTSLPELDHFLWADRVGVNYLRT